ncbi:hypothetical protein QN277_016606 [Acacia crassicarpa]|uniref:TIR domain-containing protein n=1 Tax=Acacia crassicarpa TaxID=499986 RepID=A0AAE1TCA8_9FABA|nr:hypothetical protein QN277_016606 [Acacia crassicarpa]
MAYNVGGESSSTSNTLNSSLEWKYDVFLSFAGKDTRLNFTDHLYEAFIRSGIRCFRDDVDLEKGEDINNLFQAIQDSLCAVLVISKNYAKSTWCLDELLKILESQNTLGRRVFPIFYNVNPADVRHQRESFGEALAELEKKFKENITKVLNWRTALSKIGNLSGWVTESKHEADLIKIIVGAVWSFLSTKLPSFDDNLVGIDSKVADVIPLLEIGLDDKRFVGIWGMSGVGKTTLARVVFNKLSNKFEIHCFLERVKDALATVGLVSLQKSLLYHLHIKDLKIYDSYEGMQTIKKLLYNKKVLLVLDDIDDMSQLKNLAESPDWFGKGSRIIITTRDKQVLTSIGMERIYKMKTMKNESFNSTPQWEYDVFLSFAGKDTGLNFIDHLYNAFVRSGIRCLKDDVDLPKGEDINDLFSAIEDSLCAVLVISQNYAKSTWCLDELQKILESREKLGRRIFPIFYNVKPADVRHQRESFGEALSELEEKFKENTTKVQSWRTALLNIGRLSGWVTWEDKHDADLIKKMVGEVWRFLSTKLLSFDENLVGINSKVADVIPFLDIGLDDKRFVGIWGMAGVGKTSMARAVFEKLKQLDKFDICCFLEKVKDALPLPGGLVSLQKILLSHLQIKGLEIHDSYQGMQMIRTRLQKKKVLLVLDDIDDMSQLKDLVEKPDWFGKGSRVVITTRDSHLLTSIRVESIYEMKTMKNDESLQLFSNKAFNKNHPDEKYLEYSKSVVKYAGGLPLALQALGSYFCGRSEEAVWRDALDKLKEINPHKNILEVLKISYDGLDEKEQTIFLDIVCLFKRWKKKEVTQILEACDLNPTLGIMVLIEKTLLVETESGLLDMHELHEDLGWYIIQQKSPNSRLRKFGEIKEALGNNKESVGKIEAIVVNEPWAEDKIKVHLEACSKMNRLRLLLLNFPPNVAMGLEKLSSALKFVRWPLFPLEALPLPLNELVHIEMQRSKIKQLWNGVKLMNHLKFIDLSGSPNFTETPDFSNVQSLRHLCLSRCTSLVKVHESLGVLKDLVDVDLHGCENLNSLPSKLETNSLRTLDLGWCKNVRMLPEFGEGMKKLEYLDASYTAITRLPESLGSLTGLRELNLSATGLVNPPTDCFSGLFRLVLLSFECCEQLVTLPRLPPCLIRLEAGGCYFSLERFDEELLNMVTSLDHGRRVQTKYVTSNDEEEYMPLSDMKYYRPLFNFKKVEVESGYDPLKNFFAIMPGVIVLPGFFYPNIHYMNEKKYECDIEVDIPPNFRASKWSGIVVCLHLCGSDGAICWRSKAPEDDKYNRRAEQSQGIWGLCKGIGHCVMVLEFNQETCWQHLRGDNNSLHIQVSSDYCQNKTDILQILGYGWKVICEEDIQKWCSRSHFNQFIEPQHAPLSEVKLPLGLFGRVIGIK